MKKRKKKPKHKKENVIGLAWYTREQWELLKQVADDAEIMDDTFSDWEQNAGNAARMLRQSGYPVGIVDIDVTELIQWCKSRNQPIDGEARTEFVIEKLREGRPRRQSHEKSPKKQSESDSEEIP